MDLLIPSASEEFAGVYDDPQTIRLTRQFIRYEHSDGFNFARVGLEYRMHAWNSDDNSLRFDVFPGVSAGAMISLD